MATFTDIFALVKPTYGELADVAVINGNMDTIDGIMHSNRTMLAPAFSQTEDYAVGDVVVYDGNLYRFIVPHSAGNWDGTEVEQTTLGEEVSTKGGADVTKTASGNPIEITDGASAPLVKCTTAITGSQDLHGYDKPWVGGAGKNKADISANTVSSSQTWNCTPTYSNNGVIATATGTYARIGYVIPVVSGQTITISLYALKSANTYGRIVFNSTEDWNNPEYGYKDTLESRTKHTITATTTSNILFIGLYCTTAQSSGTLTIDSVMVEYSNQATDFAPYSNICPITAYTEGEIEVRGKNALVFTNPSQTSQGVTFTANDDGTVSLNGTASANVFYILGGEFTLDAGTWVISDSGISGVSVGLLINDVNTYGEFTLTEKTTVTRGFVRVSSGTALSNKKIYPMVCKSTDTTDFEPYVDTTHTATFSQTIYQGNADFVGGEVVREWAIIDLGDRTWTKSGVRFYTTWGGSDANKPYANATELGDYLTNAICTQYHANTRNAIERDNYAFSIHDSSTVYLTVVDSRYSTVEDFKMAMSGVMLAYPLATPTTSSVTTTNPPIKSLFGYNHIESTTGDLDVEYITEEFQPLVDLIEESGGDSHTYSTTEQVVGKWIDGKDAFERVFELSSTITINSQGQNIKPLVTNPPSIETILSVQAVNDAGGTDAIYMDLVNDQYRCYCADQINNVKYVICQYTKSTPTRSLNLTKSAVVEEIPDEIKNAEYEEKPDVNEADDDAPTEVDER